MDILPSFAGKLREATTGHPTGATFSGFVHLINGLTKTFNFFFPSSLKLIEFFIIILDYYIKAENSIFFWPSVVRCLPVSKSFHFTPNQPQISFCQRYLNGCGEKKMHWQHLSQTRLLGEEIKYLTLINAFLTIDKITILTTQENVVVSVLFTVYVMLNNDNSM